MALAEAGDVSVQETHHGEELAAAQGVSDEQDALASQPFQHERGVESAVLAWQHSVDSLLTRTVRLTASFYLCREHP